MRRAGAGALRQQASTVQTGKGWSWQVAGEEGEEIWGLGLDRGAMGPLLTWPLSPQYMGCIEVLRSMRSLDFNTRTQVTR